MTAPPTYVDLVTLPHFEGLERPGYKTAYSAGMDLRCALSEPLTLAPMDRHAIPTGLKIAVPAGFEGQVRPRSGMALKMGLGVVNAPGTIDADYRGEILVPVINFSNQPLTLERGMRIAQLVIAPVIQITWKPVSKLPDSARGEGGFGHTGTR